MMIPQEMINELVRTARQASANAYAPYSHYPVGAAVLGASGRVYVGCNVENASFGLTVCAERVAVWAAATSGERSILAVAVCTPNGTAPCGACRQVLAEFAPPDSDMLVLVADAEDGYQAMRLSDLLPHAFGRQHLGGT